MSKNTMQNPTKTISEEPEEDVEPPWFVAMDSFTPLPQPTGMIFTSVTISGQGEDEGKTQEAGVLTIRNNSGINVHFMSPPQVAAICGEMMEWLREQHMQQQQGLLVADKATMKQVVEQAQQTGLLKGRN